MLIRVSPMPCSCPPCLQPHGAEVWHTCGAYGRTEHHRKKWENSPEKRDLLLELHGAGMGRESGRDWGKSLSVSIT